MEHDIHVPNYKYKEWETEQEELMAYNIKLVLQASKDLVVLIFSQYQWPPHLVIKVVLWRKLHLSNLSHFQT